MKLVWYSPTGTTKAIIRSVERGIDHPTVEALDITTPEARTRRLHTSENELLVVAVPVYMGRVPPLLIEWLQRIQAQRTPAVCIVVYGNRTYEESISPSILNLRLKELKKAEIDVRTPDGYQLTERGSELITLLRPFGTWSRKWAQEVFDFPETKLRGK